MFTSSKMIDKNSLALAPVSNRQSKIAVSLSPVKVPRLQVFTNCMTVSNDTPSNGSCGTRGAFTFLIGLRQFSGSVSSSHQNRNVFKTR